MGSLLFEVAVSILVLWFVIRFIMRVIGWTAAPADSDPDPEPEPDGLGGSFVCLRQRPKPGGPAVALAKPDNDDVGR